MCNGQWNKSAIQGIHLAGARLTAAASCMLVLPSRKFLPLKALPAQQPTTTTGRQVSFWLHSHGDIGKPLT